MVAFEYRRVKYFAGNGRNSGLNGCFGRLNGRLLEVKAEEKSQGRKWELDVLLDAVRGGD
jgi:hypothetical protein